MKTPSQMRECRLCKPVRGPTEEKISLEYRNQTWSAQRTENQRNHITCRYETPRRNSPATQGSKSLACKTRIWNWSWYLRYSFNHNFDWYKQRHLHKLNSLSMELYTFTEIISTKGFAESKVHEYINLLQCNRRLGFLRERMLLCTKLWKVYTKSRGNHAENCAYIIHFNPIELSCERLHSMVLVALIGWLECSGVSRPSNTTKQPRHSGNRSNWRQALHWPAPRRWNEKNFDEKNKNENNCTRRCEQVDLHLHSVNPTT